MWGLARATAWETVSAELGTHTKWRSTVKSNGGWKSCFATCTSQNYPLWITHESCSPPKISPSVPLSPWISLPELLEPVSLLPSWAPAWKWWGSSAPALPQCYSGLLGRHLEHPWQICKWISNRSAFLSHSYRWWSGREGREKADSKQPLQQPMLEPSGTESSSCQLRWVFWHELL